MLKKQLKFAISRNYKIRDIFRIFQNKNFGIFHRKIGNLWNFEFYKFQNLLFSEIVKFGKFLEFSKMKILEFSNVKLETYGIKKTIFWNFPT